MKKSKLTEKENKVAKRSEEQKKKSIEDRGINADVMAVKRKKGKERKKETEKDRNGEISGVK